MFNIKYKVFYLITIIAIENNANALSELRGHFKERSVEEILTGNWKRCESRVRKIVVFL